MGCSIGAGCWTDAGLRATGSCGTRCSGHAAAAVPPAVAGFVPPTAAGAVPPVAAAVPANTALRGGVSGAAAGGTAGVAITDAGYDAYGYDTSTTTHTPSPAPPLSVLPGTPDLSGITESKQKLTYQPYTANSAACTSRFVPPSTPPLHATDYNGIQMPPACFQGNAHSSDGKHHVFVIGDWGGVTHHPWNATIKGPLAADHRSKKHFKAHYRPYVYGVDDFAQIKVADAMRKRAAVNEPDYILNVGDNFYWGGVNIQCGAPPYRCADMTGQWHDAFENVYTGPGIDQKQWLGVLGNHDYGGFMFTAGWDMTIGYTWLTTSPSTGRWLQPAQYYSAKVHYDEFSIDYYFVDTNVFDTWPADADPSHNICSREHNPKVGATCGVMGPVSPDDCSKWFKKLWHAEVPWLEKGLGASTADWQIVVVHHPPEGLWGGPTWKRLAAEYGIDLIVAGHRHCQEVHYMSERNELRPTAYVVSGGGGGITSENEPKYGGEDDEYGFVDLTLGPREIMVQAISHGGGIRSTTCIKKRSPGGASEAYTFAGPSMCDGKPSGPQAPPAGMATETAPPAPAPAPQTPQVVAGTPVVAPPGQAAPAGGVQPPVPGANPQAAPGVPAPPAVVQQPSGGNPFVTRLKMMFSRFRGLR